MKFLDLLLSIPLRAAALVMNMIAGTLSVGRFVLLIVSCVIIVYSLGLLLVVL